ncbi:MAG: imidazole glycerol phosphate synthase subunit HisH [Bacteroidaceae bacterium]|nr:imidazole glycerol phosphate synthase subunit HisH [Bacteroidaceae bacterium]
MQVAIVKYGAGNVYSVVHALRRCGVEPLLTDDNERIRQADRVIFPGQGEAATTMQSVFGQGLDQLIPQLRQPVLGICIGQQLMCSFSQESGGTPCIGIFPETQVLRFEPQSQEDKIPHMGWNTIKSRVVSPVEQPSQADVSVPAAGSPLLKGLDGAYFYFVHSYYVPVNRFTIATCEYCGTPFSAAMQHRNFYATQFHPEKSGEAGERLLHNFLSLA